MSEKRWTGFRDKHGQPIADFDCVRFELPNRRDLCAVTGGNFVPITVEGRVDELDGHWWIRTIEGPEFRCHLADHAQDCSVLAVESI